MLFLPVKRLCFGLLLFSFPLLILAGCTQDAAPVSQQPAAEDGAANAAIATLEAAGAHLTRSSKDDPRVVSVNLEHVTWSPDIMPAVCHLKSMTTLVAPATVFDDTAAAALADSGIDITALDVRDCPLGDAGLTSIAGIRSLKSLKLSGKNGKTTVSDAGFAALKNHSALKALTADGIWFGSPAVSSLVTIPTLEELYAADSLIDDGALEMLVSLPRLRKLRLARTQISDDGLASLTACSTLEELDLSENSQFTDASCAALGQITSLKKLNLWRVPLTDAGIQQLSPLTALEWLNLDNTALSDAGLPALSGMTKLTFLHLGSTQISDAGIAALFPLTTLRDLKITRTAITQAGADDLQQHLPDTRIQLVYVEGQ